MAKPFQDRIQFILTQSTRLQKGCTIRTSRGGARLVHTQSNKIMVHLPEGLLEAVEEDKLDRATLEPLLTTLSLAAWKSQGAHPCVALRMHANGMVHWETRQRGLLHTAPAGEITPQGVTLRNIREVSWTKTSDKGLFHHTSLPNHEVPPEVREKVYARDNHQCVTCGTGEDLSLDHVRSRSRGGTDKEDNLQTMCRTCNGAKGAL